MPGDREKVVISLGGSILVPGEGDAEYIKSLAQLMIRLSSQYKLFLVTGGGKIARYYIEVGRKIGLDERYLDELGIDVTRLNAQLLIGALGGASNPLPASDYDQATQAGETYEIVVMGGVEPGITTDAVCVELCTRVGAVRLINATSVDGVYTADPKKDPQAKKLTVMNHKELVELVGPPRPTAGTTAVFDPLAARHAAKGKIPICVVHGRNLVALEAAVREEKFDGTLVVTE